MSGPDPHAEPILVWGRRAGRRTAIPFDARDLIGLEVTEGEALADRHGCRLRVLVQDGKDPGFLIEDDLRGHRINVATVDNIIVEVLGVY